MTEMSGGDPIRAMADKLREEIDRVEGKSIVATRRIAQRRTVAASRRRGGKSTAVIRGR